MLKNISTRYLATGNEYLTIPTVSADDAGINAVGFVYEDFRGCVELHGSPDQPLLAPLVEVDGQNMFAGDLQSDLISYWIPRFSCSASEVEAEYSVFAPMDRRGFVCVLTLRNGSDREKSLRVGWRGCWETSQHTAKVSKPMVGVKHANISPNQPGTPVIEFRGHYPLYAISIVSEQVMSVRLWSDDQCVIDSWTKDGVRVQSGKPLFYELSDEISLAPHQEVILPLYIGVGLEDISAVASANELRLQNWDRLLSALTNWLSTHTIQHEDDHFKRLINVNSFYNYFYSQAIAIDTEDLVLMAARSSDNDSCAVYVDSDAMRWSMPAVLQIDWSQARNMLIYAFTTQLRNVGMHSRFINGVVFQPGMQLDQLCAPIRALHIYVELTGDMSILFDRRVQTGVNTIQQILAAQRHPEVALFETLLLPSGEPSRYPYECFSNLLVWRVLHDLSGLYGRIRDIDRAQEAGNLAALVRSAIVEHFIVQGPSGKMYARSIDLQGGFELGDDPMGSLQLLTYFGFCSSDDEVYRNTMRWLQTHHNPHMLGNYIHQDNADQRSAMSLISVVNDLLTHHKFDALEFLKHAELDNGLAAEVVDTATGKAVAGRSFASCSGFLAFALRLAVNAKCPDTALVRQKERPSETLYEPPPEPSHDTRKARL